MGQVTYALKGNWMKGQNFYQGYIQIDADSNMLLVSNKSDATLFDSQVLARGWFTKVQMKFPTYRFTITSTT